MPRAVRQRLEGSNRGPESRRRLYHSSPAALQSLTYDIGSNSACGAHERSLQSTALALCCIYYAIAAHSRGRPYSSAAALQSLAVAAQLPAAH
jgi:hypothetical protein